jgi:hypothetical protein
MCVHGITLQESIRMDETYKLYREPEAVPNYLSVLYLNVLAALLGDLSDCAAFRHV